MTAAIKDLTRQRRRFMNPFKDLAKISTVVQASLKNAREYFDSADEIAGLGLSTILRRLGLDEVFPVLAKKGVHTLADLAAYDEKALENAGVVEGRNVNGVFEVTVANAADARSLLVRFARVATQRSAAERASLLARYSPTPNNSQPTTPKAAAAEGPMAPVATTTVVATSGAAAAASWGGVVHVAYYRR